MPRIFISHCAAHDKRSQVVIDRLMRDFKDNDTELVWDRDLLQVGDDWNDRLLDEMETCDGAILLVGEPALKRSYVVLECTLLAQRKRHSEKWGGNLFELLLVLIGGLSPEDLADPSKSYMKDINLGRYQAGNDDNLDVLVEALKPRLQRLKIAYGTSGPRRQLLSDVATQILSGKPGSVTKLATLLKIALPAWINSGSPELRAWAVAMEMPDKALRMVGRALAEAKDDIDIDSALAIVERLAPFRVPGDAAARIPEIAADFTRARCIEVNATSTETGRWYARLAYGRMLMSEMTWVTNADSGLGTARLFDEIVKCIQEQTISDTVDEAKKELAHMGAPFFVLVPAIRPLPEVVELVYRDFPTVTLIFLTGQKGPPAAQRPQTNFVTLLEPLLESTDEEVAWTNYINTQSDISRAHGRGRSDQLKDPIRHQESP
jgi:hypothetical protein